MEKLLQECLGQDRQARLGGGLVATLTRDLVEVRRVVRRVVALDLVSVRKVGRSMCLVAQYLAAKYLMN